MTFGFKLLVWHEEVGRHIARLENALRTISVGRISGSVGTYIHLDPRVEVMALRSLKLAPAKVSTQVLQRDRHAEVLSALALLATSSTSSPWRSATCSGPRLWSLGRRGVGQLSQ